MIEIIQEILKTGPVGGTISLAVVVFVLTLYYRVQKRITLTHMILVDEDIISLETLEKYHLLDVRFW